MFSNLVGFVLNWVSLLIEAALLIPIVGRVFKQLFISLRDLALDVILFGGMALDFGLSLLGIQPEKKMRLCVIIQTVNEQPIVPEQIVLDAIQFAIDVFKDLVNVRILPHATLNFSDNLRKPTSAGSADITYSPAGGFTLQVEFTERGYGQDLHESGTQFNQIMIDKDFYGNGRRLIGYGAPSCAFAIQSFNDGKKCCSMGPLTDYVTVQLEYDDQFDTINAPLTDQLSTTLAHELGHACNLSHYINLRIL